ncbi:MAG: phage terminase large subunit family protein [Planctomycetota bacterium]|jgi:hypothetical protein
MASRNLEVILPPLHPGQIEVDECDARFIWLACGRRWGKTTYGIDLCLRTGLQGGFAWWVAPDYPRSRPGWRELRRMANQIPGAKVNKADRTVELPGGGWIEVRSADRPESLVGEGLDLLIMDEAALIQERAWEESLWPALGDREGRALFIFSPKGRNWAWRRWHTAREGDDPEGAAFVFPTSSNPHFPRKSWEAIRRAHAEGRMADRVFRQEWLAEFIEDTGGVFRRVREAADAELQDKAVKGENGVDGHEYVIGADWAKHSDFNVFTVVDLNTKSVVAIDRSNHIDYTLQVKRLKALSDRFKPLEIIAETNAMGEPIIEQLRLLDLPVRGFTTSNASKTEAIEALSLAFETGDIHIPADEGLIAELQAFEGTPLQSGRTRYSAPAGMHDDRVDSLWLAWSGVASSEIGFVEFG